MKYDNGEWEKWIRLATEKGVKSTLEETPKKYKPLVAAALSVGKWHPNKPRRGGNSTRNCGLCVNYSTMDWAGLDCGSCPLYKEEGDCGDYGTPFMKWYNSRGKKRKETADEMHALLLKIYEAEYKRVIG